MKNNLIYILIFLCFTITSSAYCSNKNIKSDLRYFASLSANYLYEVDEEQLPIALEPYLAKYKHIKAIKIIESVDNATFMTYYNDGVKSIFNQPIPKTLKQLKSISSEITFDKEVIGKIVIYYKNELKVTLSKEEDQWLNRNPIIKIAMMHYWPHDNKGNSLHTEVLKLINKYTGTNMVPIKFSAWTDGFTQATKGEKLHGIMGLGWSKERENNYFYYTPAYNFSPSYLVTRKDNLTLKSLDDLNDKTIYLKEMSVTHNLMKQEVPSAKIIDKPAIEDMYKSLFSSNEADALVADFINQEKLRIYNLKVAKEIYSKFGEVAIGVHHQYPELASIINKAYKDKPKKELSI